ncbi:MAG: pantoate--beta-alanine ligase [Prevotellaceae bacterium]|jgi:pantoate--beta-alanine ligase|nr:pantoate--beta-alanine ligase [Prevotellaceae bacterium]
MKIIKEIKALQQAIAGQKAQGKTVGFVPTMGALHAGHLSLVQQCMGENDVCVVSIFVNPTQFNDPSDLEKYPRTPGADSLLLERAGVDIVFAPGVGEMYPEKDTRTFDFGMLDKVMEGKFRAGHFNGVAQVVSKLFDIVKPGRAYFGEKDFQQLAIIRQMVKDYSIPVEIVACPIVREESGLAMSSRNERLTAGERKKAALIFRVLSESRIFASSKSVAEVRKEVIDTLNKEELFEVEYFEIVDGNTLQPVENWEDSAYIVGCIALFCGQVRLIDNIRYK